MRLVVGPHPDDAVLGAGSYLAESHDAVLTVFAGVPAPGILGDYDRARGFGDSAEAMAVRNRENDDALAALGCAGTGLGLLDGQYPGPRPHQRDVAHAVQAALEATGAEGVVGPLGVQHPDHVLVGEACLVLANLGVPIWLYEELPYRVVWPEHAARRHDDVRSQGWHLVPDFLGGGPIEAKARAVSCFVSQDLDVHCCLVPERFWAVTP